MIFFVPINFNKCFCAQKNRLIETVLLSTHNICCCFFFAGPRSAVGNVSGYRCVSDCSSRGREFDPGPVPYFRGD